MHMQTSPFDSLSDEILLKILNCVTSDPYPFHLEFSTDRALRSQTAAERYEQSRAQTQETAVAYTAPPPYITIHYPHAGTAFHLNPFLPKSQASHITDWLIINTTCRRFRRLGKQCFWENKRFVMTYEFPSRLESGAFRMAPVDQAFALQHISDLTLTCHVPHRVSYWVGLANVAKKFPRLRRFTFWLDHIADLGPREQLRHMAGEQLGKGSFMYTRGSPPEDEMHALRLLMQRTGLPEHVQLQIVFVANEWAFMRDLYLRKDVYPMLELKAKMLANRKTSA